MKVKDLILCHPVGDIANAFINRLRIETDHREKAVQRMTSFILTLRDMEPCETRHLLLGIYHFGVDGEFLDSCLHVRNPDSYSFEFSPWNEFLSYELGAHNVQEVGAADLCTEILFEMTFSALKKTKNKRWHIAQPQMKSVSQGVWGTPHQAKGGGSSESPPAVFWLQKALLAKDSFCLATNCQPFRTCLWGRVEIPVPMNFRWIASLQRFFGAAPVPDTLWQKSLYIF